MIRTTIESGRGRAAALGGPCALGSFIAGAILCGMAVTTDLPRAAYGLKGDESTYYSMAYSLALDGDFVYERHDLSRVWKEFPAGPEGIFLKRGKEVDWDLTGRFPFLERKVTDDPRQDRLYYGKSFIYPLAVAPFVRLFGTNGFLLFHALILTLTIAAGAAFLSARSAPGPSIGYSLVFLFCSVVPVYMIWVSPEIFNFGLVFFACFLWLYKEVAPGANSGPGGWWRRFLFSGWSDHLAAVMIALATFSKPVHVLLVLPLFAWAAWQRRWRHLFALGVVFAFTVAALFAANAAITGEFNYQGGDRNTFYGRTGFPFLTRDAGFRSAETHSTNEVPLDVLANRDALLTVFPHNIYYFVFGRHSGLLAYYGPALISSILFLLSWRSRERWQLLVAGTVALGAAALLLYMPYTYSGGGGSLGNRYFLAFYPLFLFLTPPLGSLRAVAAGAVLGGVFSSQLLFNPFYASFYPAELPTRWPFKVLPVEMTLIDDMPMSVIGSRVRQPVGGNPPALGYFLDYNTFLSPDGTFWVRGESTAQIVLRMPARQASDGSWQKVKLRRLHVELQMGEVANRVELRLGSSRREVEAAPGEKVVVDLEAGDGFPYRRLPGHPSNDLHLLTIGSATGFVPMFGSGTAGVLDRSLLQGIEHRFLGVRVRLEPVYDEGLTNEG